MKFNCPIILVHMICLFSINVHAISDVSAVCEIPENIPSKLSETCFYKLLSGNSQNKYTNFFEYEPQYPAYSDGATKRRWIYIPKAEKINTEDIDNWVFPKGTVIFKQFAFENKKIELRVMEKISQDIGRSAWRFSNYAWRTDGSDADLVTNSFYAQNETELAGYSAGAIQNQFKIAMPKTCMKCHSGAADTVNGFNYLQLSSQAIMFNLNQIAAAGILSSPPKVFDSIQGTVLDQKAIGYIQSNCAICHAPKGIGPGNFLHSSSATSLESENVMQTASANELIVKGNPDKSILMQMFSSGEMPLVSPVHQDSAGVELIRSWISKLQ